jgi:hypothetical protein
MRAPRLAMLTGSVIAAALIGMPTALAATAPPSVLTGDGQGSFEVTQTSAADGPTVRVLRGHGEFSIGAATIRGVVSAPGFVYEGSCRASVRLVTADGAIKIAGHSQVRSRSGDKPICDGHHFRFHFHTVKATGDLADASYKGVGLFDLKDATDDMSDGGTFTLMLRVPRG